MAMPAQVQDVVQSRSSKSSPPRKRRKLADATATATSGPVAQRQRRPSTIATSTTPGQCMSCHRSQPPGGTIPCAICSSLTCLICARQCTAAPAIVSTPPTPRLSNSPTPPATPVRNALALAPTNLAAGGQKKERERRKRFQEEEEEDAECEWEWVAGCGRTMCQECCIENDATHGNTCLNCYGLPLHPSFHHASPDA